MAPEYLFFFRKPTLLFFFWTLWDKMTQLRHLSLPIPNNDNILTSITNTASRQAILCCHYALGNALNPDSTQWLLPSDASRHTSTSGHTVASSDISSGNLLPRGTRLRSVLVLKSEMHALHMPSVGNIRIGRKKVKYLMLLNTSDSCRFVYSGCTTW